MITLTRRFAATFRAAAGRGSIPTPLAPNDGVVQARSSIMSDLDIFWLLGVLALCLWPLAPFLPQMEKGAAPAH